MSKFEKYDRAVRFLEGLYNLPVEAEYMKDRNSPEIYLKRFQYFLDMIGNPEKGFKYVHITGTAGKGTVSNLIHRALVLSGKKVGLVTSPFVTTTIEKIQVDSLYISPNDFAYIVEYLEPFIDRAYLKSPFGRPSYFEILFAVALVYFKRQNCDWVVLEVGCGGRYDYTNVIKKPEVAVITNVDYDHTEVIGPTLTKIAYEKSGIIKSGCRFWTAEQRPHVLKVIEKECRKNKVVMNKIKASGNAWDTNKKLVEAIVEDLGLCKSCFEEAKEMAVLPCRFETISLTPRIILDGAHNGVKIASTIQNLKKLKYRRLIVVFGIAHNKDYADIVPQITKVADYIFITRPQIAQRKCAHPLEIFNLSGEEKIKAEIILDPFRALEEAKKIANKDDLILVTGSLFLAGDLRTLWYPAEWVLSHRRSF